MHDYGVNISAGRSRKVTLHDFLHFDYVFAVDEIVLDSLRAKCPENLQKKVTLLIPSVEVSDPYYGNAKGFEVVAKQLWTYQRDIVSKFYKR